MTGLEIWKAVVGFEGAYEVSNLGRVRSLDRTGPARSRWGQDIVRVFRGRILAGGPHPNGYITMHLYLDGVRRPTVLHIIVAEAFHGPRPSPGHEVRHLDNDRKNCVAENIKWGTRAEQQADKERHGTVPRGEKSSSAKLNAADVQKIRARVGEPQQNLADEFGCTFSNISAIQRRKSWRHVA
jgi:hypothetical protein